MNNVGQQGKYFYVTFDSPPHAVLHLGMTGWIKFNTEETGYYKQAKKKEDEQEWPPKYMKFLLKCESEKVNGESREPVEVAFIDARRLARIRLVDCDAARIRDNSPLKENGPDPVIDKDVVTVDWLAALLRKKKVPVKALLLDQGNISGIGNWVADEIMYQAKIHPEQYSNTFDDAQIKSLHDAIMHVCTTACDTLADSTQFPETWLMKYRWDKGKKDSNVLPNGEKIVHLKVGGRTSAIVPSVQKKTAAVAGDVDKEDDGSGGEDAKPAKSRKRKAKATKEEDEEETEEVMPAKKQRGKKAKAEESVVDEDGEAVRGRRGKKAKAEEAEVAKKDSTAKASKAKKGKTKADGEEKKVATPGSRRSARTKSR